jgi:hypothetical protein
LIEESAKYWSRRAGVAMMLSFAAFFVALPSCCGTMAWHYEQLHPHAKQNEIAAFYFAVPAAILLAGLVFGALMLRAYVWRRRQIADAIREGA